MMVDIESLISKVFLRPEIWDRSLKIYSNRVTVDNSWQEIAKEMGVEDSAIRKKWKYLRDQFCVELGKAESSRSGRSRGEPRWPHFKALLFLKDVVKPRAYSNPTPRKITSPPYAMDDTTEEGDDTADQTEDDCEDGNEECKDVQLYDVRDQNQAADDDRQNLPREKRRRIQGRCSETVSETGKGQGQLSEEDLKIKIDSISSENEDLLFFRSLLPHVSRIPDHLKLRFRSRIQEVVDEFAYNSDF